MKDEGWRVQEVCNNGARLLNYSGDQIMKTPTTATMKSSITHIPSPTLAASPAMYRKHFIQFITLSAFVGMSAGVLFAASKPEEEAQKAAEKWLGLVDGGEIAASWDAAAGYFKAAVSKQQWESSVGPIRKEVGGVISRKLKSAKYAKSLPGAPDGEYVVLQFDTSFANKKEAIETVTPMLDKDGKWKVSGYFIK